MTMYNQNQYQNQYQNQMEGGELSDGMMFTAEDLGDYDKSYTLLPEGEYPFTVVNIATKRYSPGPNSKIGPCKQVTVTLRVQAPDGNTADLDHNLFMWNTKACVGMITQFFDSVGLHKKGEPLRLNWNENVLIGTSGTLRLRHRIHKDDTNKPVEEQRRYNDIQKLLPKSDKPAFKAGNF